MKVYDEVTELEKDALIHEIKCPLSIIKAHVDYIRLMETTGRYEKNFDSIDNELSVLEELICEYLSDCNEEEFSAVYIDFVLSEVAARFAGLPGVNVKIISHAANNLQVLGLEGELSILFSNVFKNALEAVEGVGQVTVSVEEAKGLAVIRIGGEGELGIKPHERNQVSNFVYSSKPGGSGLGLKICKNITARHGGAFTLVEEVGGMTAVITLPLA